MRAIDWDRLRGAYGLDADVAWALETLRGARRAHTDAFDEAWCDVLCRHAIHEGEAFPVTAAVVPFVIEVVERSPALAGDRAMRAEVALWPAMAGAAAREGKPRVRARTLAALEAAAPRLVAWAEKKTLRDAALAALCAVPSLTARTVESYPEARVLHAVLTHASLVEPAARRWAASRLAAIDHPVMPHAVSLLRRARIEPYEEYRLAALADALALMGRARRAALDALTARFDPRRFDPAPASTRRARRR